MADSIESFVTRLQQEGVESGRQQAEALLAQARSQAQRIVEDARAEARGIVEGAQRAASTERARTESELKLAARDVALRLQRALADALRAALGRGAERKLTDPEFLASVLRELILTYARADASRQLEIEIRLPPEMIERLAEWALREIREVRNGAGSTVEIDLQAALDCAGFEYKIQGATVEVTVESVVERMMELVGPAVRELFAAPPAKTTP